MMFVFERWRQLCLCFVKSENLFLFNALCGGFLIQLVHSLLTVHRINRAYLLIVLADSLLTVHRINSCRAVFVLWDEDFSLGWAKGVSFLYTG